MADDLGALGSLIGVDAAKEWRGALSAARDSSYARERDIRTALDEATASVQAQRQGQVNMPLLMWAAGMGQPTRAGSFAESLSQGLQQAGPAITAQRAEEQQQQGALQKLRMAGIDAGHGGAMERVGLANAPLDMLAKIGPLGLQQQKLQMELADRAAQRRAFLEAQGGGGPASGVSPAPMPTPTMPGNSPGFQTPLLSAAPITSPTAAPGGALPVPVPPSSATPSVSAPAGSAAEFSRLATIYGGAGDFARAREYQEKAILARAVEAKAAADAEAAVRKETAAADQAKITGTDSLRKEIDALPQTKVWKNVAPVFNSMIRSSALNSKAADLDLVIGLAKILDPDSVVREGEAETVRKTGGFFDQIQGWLSSVNGGASLPPDVRAGIMQIAASRVGEHRKAFDAAIAPYVPIIQERSWKPEHVMPGVLPMPTYDPAVIAQTPRPQGGPGAQPTTQWAAPPQQAIDTFKANKDRPGERDNFDAIFGPGAAARVLGGR